MSLPKRRQHGRALPPRQAVAESGGQVVPDDAVLLRIGCRHVRGGWRLADEGERAAPDGACAIHTRRVARGQADEQVEGHADRVVPCRRRRRMQHGRRTRLPSLEHVDIKGGGRRGGSGGTCRGLQIKRP